MQELRSDKRASTLRVFTSRLVLSVLLWWVLTGGAVGLDALLVGVPTAIAAAAASTRLMSPVSVSFAGALRFAEYFLWESLRGGVDVARRAFDPRMPLAPAIIEHEMNLTPALARVAVANTASLLPGSLTVELEGRHLFLHVLDAGQDAAAALVSTERRVADLLGVPLHATRDTDGRIT